MANGYYLEQCHDFLFNKLLKKWAEFGINPVHGFSYESLTKDWQPNPVGRVRLLTQCRQLYTFSHAYLVTKDKSWEDVLQPLYRFIIDYYVINDESGNFFRWRFSLNEKLEPLDDSTDAYALAFILLSFSFYYQATNDKSALRYIGKTHHFLNENLSATNGGFYESYPIDLAQQRRQNPHMHLLEGYIAAFEATGKKEYKTQIENLLQLALSHFYDKKTHSLIEFFTPDWQPDQNLGHIIEPGHHFEWGWLLHKAHSIIPKQDYLDMAQQLWNKAYQNGFDPNGGIYNQVDRFTNSVIDQEKRIWPITEYLKAVCVQLKGKSEQTDEMELALAFLFQHYLNDNGSWNEYLDENNEPKDYPLPGTTSYHIFLGLIEALNLKK